MNKKIIVLEVNEVPDRVIDSYVSDNPNSNWAKVLRKSARFVAETPDETTLHPKISWQTFHRAVPDTQHGYMEYNQVNEDADDQYPPVWELIRNAGKSIGVGASLGSFPVPKDRNNVDFYLPDPFAPTDEAYPEHLSSFQKLNTMAVQNSGRNVRSGGFGLKEVGHFVFNLPRLGITLSTMTKIVKQLVSERRNSVRIVRRRNIQALMTFDVALKQVSTSKPDFSTIFANHVAANMHRYWAAKFVDDYEDNKMPQEWREAYGDEIDNAMMEADYMIGQLDKFITKNPEYSVLVVASMGQAAIEHEIIESQLVVKDFDRFMQAYGFEKGDYEKKPGMEPEYVVAFKNDEMLQRFEEQCNNTDIAGQYVECTPSNNGQCAFHVHQYNLQTNELTIGNKHFTFEEAGLYKEPIQDLAGSTAQHTADGCCFVFNGHSDLSGLSNMNSPCDLVAVTSSILSSLDVDLPGYMKKPVPALVQAFGDDATPQGMGSEPSVASS